MRWSWHGFVASILALSVAVGFAAAMVGATVQAEPITQQGAALLNTLGGALIGAVAGWLGGAALERNLRSEGTKMSDQHEPETPAEPVTDPATVPGAHPVQDTDAPAEDPGTGDDTEATDDDDAGDDPEHRHGDATFLA